MDDRKLSEKDHSKELGLHKIWDAGQRLYIWNQIHNNSSLNNHLL